VLPPFHLSARVCSTSKLRRVDPNRNSPPSPESAGGNNGGGNGNRNNTSRKQRVDDDGDQDDNDNDDNDSSDENGDGASLLRIANSKKLETEEGLEAGKGAFIAQSLGPGKELAISAPQSKKFTPPPQHISHQTPKRTPLLKSIWLAITRGVLKNSRNTKHLGLQGNRFTSGKQPLLLPPPSSPDSPINTRMLGMKRHFRGSRNARLVSAGAAATAVAVATHSSPGSLSVLERCTSALTHVTRGHNEQQNDGEDKGNKTPPQNPLQKGKIALLVKELRSLDRRGLTFKALELLRSNKDVNFTNSEDQRLKRAIEQRAEDCAAVLREVADDRGWAQAYNSEADQFQTLYKHEKGDPVHGIKMRAVFNASATSVLAVLREFDLTKTWNAHMKGAAQLGFPSPVSLQAYGAGFMPWGPFKTRDVLFNGFGVDALEDHGCIALIFQSTKNPLCALPSVSQRCVRADFRRSGVVLEPLPAAPGTESRVLASMVLYGDPKMNVPGWLAAFGLKVFAPTMKRDTDMLLDRMLKNPDSPYVMRQKQCPDLYEMLDRRVEEYLSYTSRAPPVVDGVFASGTSKSVEAY